MKTLQRTGVVVALVAASLGISSETVVQAAMPASITQVQSSIQQDSQTIAMYSRQLTTLNAEVATLAHQYAIAKSAASKAAAKSALANAKAALTNLQQIRTTAIAKLGTDFSSMTKLANQVKFKLTPQYLVSLAKF